MRGKHFSPSSFLFLRVYFRWEGSVCRSTAPGRSPYLPANHPETQNVRGIPDGTTWGSPPPSHSHLSPRELSGNEEDPLPTGTNAGFPRGVARMARGCEQLRHVTAFNGQPTEKTSDSSLDADRFELC